MLREESRRARTGITRYLPGSRAILANSSRNSSNDGRLSASSIQPKDHTSCHTCTSINSRLASSKRTYHTGKKQKKYDKRNPVTVTTQLKRNILILEVNWESTLHVKGEGRGGKKKENWLFWSLTLQVTSLSTSAATTTGSLQRRWSRSGQLVGLNIWRQFMTRLVKVQGHKVLQVVGKSVEIGNGCDRIVSKHYFGRLYGVDNVVRQLVAYIGI